MVGVGAGGSIPFLPSVEWRIGADWRARRRIVSCVPWLSMLTQADCSGTFAAAVPEVVMKRCLILIAAVLLAGCASDDNPKPEAPPKPRPAGLAGYMGDTGASPVGVIPTAMLHDAQRDKDVDLSIEYPTRGGPFPIIIFSHGYGGSNLGYEALASFWTGYGYVVIRPAHADARKIAPLVREEVIQRRRDRNEQRRDEARDRERQRERMQEQKTPRPNVAEAIWDREREQQWRDRARDITLVVDSLDQIEQRFPELKGKMDHTRIGVGGHSYGAFTTMLLSGGQTFGNPALKLGDARIKAALEMSPQGVAANRGLTTESWRNVRIPVLYMTGSRDFGADQTEGPDWRRGAFDNSPAGDKFFALIEGARHLSFTGMIGAIDQGPEGNNVYDPTNPNGPVNPNGPTDPRTGQQVMQPQQQRRNVGYVEGDRNVFRNIRSVSLIFWDGYLKDDPKARELLKPDTFGSSVVIVKK